MKENIDTGEAVNEFNQLLKDLNLTYAQITLIEQAVARKEIEAQIKAIDSAIHLTQSALEIKGYELKAKLNHSEEN